MRVKVSYIATIPNQDLVEAGISLTDDDAIQDYFYEMGGEESFHDYGENFIILDREIN